MQNASQGRICRDNFFSRYHTQIEDAGKTYPIKFQYADTEPTACSSHLVRKASGTVTILKSVARLSHDINR